MAATLFWKSPSGVRTMLASPFATESDFEKTVFENAGLLADIFLLKRQVRGGGKRGIPDIIGVDNDGKVCIIEMKNVPVDASIIPQVLEYAFWAERNPDAIKSLWLESNDRPENATPNWDNLEVRILIVAPTILHSTIGLVGKINYAVDLIEIKRWVDGRNVILVVNRLEEDDDRKAKPRTTKGLPVYDIDFYKRERNPKSAVLFMQYARELDALVKKKGWTLEMKFNGSYCGFKAGFFNAFGIQWVGTRTFAFFVKLTQPEARALEPPMTRYEQMWKQAVYFIEPGKTKIADFLPLFEKAYKKLT